MTGHVGFAGGWTTATTQSGGSSPELRQRRRIDAPRAPGGSPCPCASRGTNGRCGGGRGSPELSPRRRPELGACGDGGYGTGTSRKGGGKRRSPHSGVVEQLGRLGEALFGANRRRGSMVAGEEDDDADGDAVRPGLLILSAQMRKTFSQQLDTGRGLGCTMATVLVVGGDGYVRSRSRKGLEGEGENRGSSERVGRTGTTPRRGGVALSSDAGRQPGGVALACGRVDTPLPTGRG